MMQILVLARSLLTKRGNVALLKKTLMTLMAASLVLSPAAIEAELSPVHKPYGGTLTIGFDHRPTIVNPILTDHSLSAAVMALVFNRLVRLTPSGEIEPDLAESWDISPDGMIYTFHLRKGVHFHDGAEFTAADALFTYGRIKDPKVRSPYFYNFDVVERFKMVDRYTFQAILKKSSPFFIYEMVREIAPKHLYEKEDLQIGGFNYKPVGTGPFKFKEWASDDRITLEANAEYYEGRPYLDNVVYKNFSERTKVWSALMRGEIDLMVFLNVDDYELTRNDAAFKTYTYPAAEYYTLFYNLQDLALADKKVRKAIAYALNRKGLIQEMEKGYAVECTGPFSPNSWAFNPNVRPFPYDPVKAQELLRQAGWEDKDHDGILEKNGSPLEMSLSVDQKSKKMKKIGMRIRQQLQEVGIKTIVMDRSKGDVDHFQAYLGLNVGMWHDPYGIIKDWHSGVKFQGKTWVSGDINPKVDRLIELGGRARNEQVRRLIFRHLHRLIYEEQPMCFLYFPYIFHACSKRIQGEEGYLNFYMLDYKIKDIYINEASKN